MTGPLPMLFHKDGLAKDVVELGEENPWGLAQGARIRLVNGSFSQLATVDLVAGVSRHDSTHITSSRWTGASGVHGYLEALSPAQYKIGSLKQSVKMQIGLFCVLVSVAASYLTAAIAKDGSFQPHLGVLRWALFAITIAATFGAWLKDLWN